MDQQLREWIEQHVGQGVEYSGHQWLIAGVRGGAAVLASQEGLGLRTVGLMSLQRRWVADNAPPHEEDR